MIIHPVASVFFEHVVVNRIRNSIKQKRRHQSLSVCMCACVRRVFAKRNVKI